MKNWIKRILGINKLTKDVIPLKWTVYGVNGKQNIDMTQYPELLGVFDSHGLLGLAVKNAQDIHELRRRLDKTLVLSRDIELNRLKINEIERRLSEKTNVSEKITSMKPGDWIDPKDFDQVREAFNAMKIPPGYVMSCDPADPQSPSSLGYSPWGVRVNPPTETLIGKIRESSANERLAVYRTALEYIKSGREDTLCNAISLAHSKIRLVKINILDMEDSYPELSYVRPRDARKKEYWWSSDDRDSRIIALDFIISYLSKEPLPRYLREKIYREALKMFVENEAIVGLCSLLSQAVGKVCGTPVNATNEYMIPELNNQKPAGESLTGGFWWPKSDRGSRKVALLNMIRSVTPETLSANTRQDVYTIALEIYRTRRAGGICNTINDACLHLGLDAYTSMDNLLKAFPEFERIRKKGRFPKRGFWWDEKNVGARISILELMIEEAFNKI